MQRVLSLEASRCTDTSGEFVSKRLCISFMFSVAFFALLGGYLLGRYATDRAIILRKKAVLQNIQVEEAKSFESVNGLSEMVKRINNITKTLSQTSNVDKGNYSELYERLKCDLSTALIPNKEQFEKDISLESSRIVRHQLKSLENCYRTVGDLLDRYVTRDENRK